jgi:hypothetical protein
LHSPIKIKITLQAIKEPGVQGVGYLFFPGGVAPAALVLGLLDEGDVRVALDDGDAAQG